MRNELINDKHHECAIPEITLYYRVLFSFKTRNSHWKEVGRSFYRILEQPKIDYVSVKIRIVRAILCVRFNHSVGARRSVKLKKS